MWDFQGCQCTSGSRTLPWPCLYFQGLWPGTPQQVVVGGVPNVTLQRFKSAFPFKVTTKTEKKDSTPNLPLPRPDLDTGEIKVALSPTSRALRLNKGRTTKTHVCFCSLCLEFKNLFIRPFAGWLTNPLCILSEDGHMSFMIFLHSCLACISFC